MGHAVSIGVLLGVEEVRVDALRDIRICGSEDRQGRLECDLEHAGRRQVRAFCEKIDVGEIGVHELSLLLGSEVVGGPRGMSRPR